MSIYKTAYETTVGKGFITNKITNAIREVLVIDMPIDTYKGFNNDSSSEQPILAMITGRTSIEKNVPNFSHVIEIIGIDKKSYLFCDVRSAVNSSDKTGQADFVVKNRSEFMLCKARLAMTKAWINRGPESLFGMSLIPCSVFSSWISEAVARRFALTALEQAQLAIISCFYYQSLFIKENEFDLETRDRFNAICVRATKLPAKLVFETTDRITRLDNIDDFCSTVKLLLENPRLEDFNAGLLILMLKGSWFGTNAADMVAVSLEHPPVWICLIYAAMAERTYKSSNLARLVERFAKGGADNFFIRAFVLLVKDITNNYKDDDSF